jgi:Integrase core domain
VTGFAHSTVWKVLRRAGISRPPKRPKEPANNYEWPCPGDLLHMDTSRYARFLRPGHRVTGDRSQQSRRSTRPETPVGYEYAHAIVDDHSRLAFVELHDNERAATVTRFAERALAFFAEHGNRLQAATDRRMIVKWRGAASFARVAVGAGDRRSEAQTVGAYGVCRVALPFEGVEDARPGVAPAPAFGGPLERQSLTSRRYAASACRESSRSAS